MDTIRRPSYYGSGGTETIDFIQCINGIEPHINELWCLGLDRIYRKVHHTAREEILAGTVREFVNNYLDENGRQILIIGRLSINHSVQFLGLFDQAWGSGLPYITSLLAQVEATGWVGCNNSNQNWGGWFNDANIITNVAWGVSFGASPTNLPRSLGYLRADQ